MADRNLVIGLDIGGTKIASGLVDVSSGEIQGYGSRPVDTRTDTLIRQIDEIIEELLAVAQREREHCSRVGMGLPEIVTARGKVTSSQTFNLTNVDWAGHVATDLPVSADSDVRCAALAEAQFGSGRGKGLFYYVSLGTGLSGSLVVEGNPLVGEHGSALVLGTGTIPLSIEPGSERNFSLEKFASGKGITSRYRSETGVQLSGAREVIKRAEEGDSDATRIVGEAGFALGVAIATIVNVLDPGLIVVGGGLGTADGPYREAMGSAVREHIWHRPARDTPILPAALGASSGVVGAALSASKLR